jgi:3-deoxy-D-manno-octulosonate 8-phosphate phosphatase KdsC-like HAD superfamily phosphatase
MSRSSRVGWPIAVADAHPAVLQAARLVLGRPGGSGAVRELCDLIMVHRERAGRAAMESGQQDVLAGTLRSTAA